MNCLCNIDPVLRICAAILQVKAQDADLINIIAIRVLSCAAVAGRDRFIKHKGLAVDYKLLAALELCKIKVKGELRLGCGGGAAAADICAVGALYAVNIGCALKSIEEAFPVIRADRARVLGGKGIAAAFSPIAGIEVGR